MSIRDIHNPWRDSYRVASFRDATFHTETDSRTSGRRRVDHLYPKRNIPYSEDMGRAAKQFTIRGYLIGPNYLDLKDRLIAALEEDGPGTLCVPLPYRPDVTIEVMSGPYTVMERRELGGYCEIEMDFSEAGKSGAPIQPPQQVIGRTAGDVMTTMRAYIDDLLGGVPLTQDQVEQLWEKDYRARFPSLT